MMDRLILGYIWKLVFKHRSIDMLMNVFVHTLDTTPKNWYTETELHRGIESWSLLTEGFKVTFGFESEYPQIENALGVIRMKLFDDFPLLIDNQLDWVVQMESAMECYNFTVDDKEEDPHNVNIPESEGSCDVQGPALEIPKIIENVKIKKVNIGMEANPKFASIGDYQDDESVGHIADLLQEYQDLFPMKFTEMKGILGDLEVMRIPLKIDVKPIKQCPYRLNPGYKEKVRQELDKMIAVGMFESVEESEWVSPMVVQDKKTKGEIRIYVDLRKLNDASMHDPFPTPFTDEVLDNMGGQEVYSFTDGFSGYHQIKIHKEDRHKTTFATKWGSFQYTMMPFGLKNAPTIFSRVIVAIFKEYLHKFLEVYFDDWTVFGLLKKHVEALRLMLAK